MMIYLEKLSFIKKGYNFKPCIQLLTLLIVSVCDFKVNWKNPVLVKKFYYNSTNDYDFKLHHFLILLTLSKKRHILWT